MSKEDPGPGEKPSEENGSKGMKSDATSSNNTKMFILPPHILQNLAFIQTHSGTTLEMKKNVAKPVVLTKSSPADTQSALFVSQEHNYNCKDRRVVSIDEKTEELENTSTSENTQDLLEKADGNLEIRKLDKHDFSSNPEKIQQVSESKEVLDSSHSAVADSHLPQETTAEIKDPSSKNPPQPSLAKSRKVKIKVNGLKRGSVTTDNANEVSTKLTPSKTVACDEKIADKSPEPVNASENQPNIRSSKRVRKKKEFSDYITPKSLDKIFQSSATKSEKKVEPVETIKPKKPRGRQKQSSLVTKIPESDIESREHLNSELIENSTTIEKNSESNRSKRRVSINSEIIVTKNFVENDRSCKETENFPETSGEKVLELDVSENETVKDLDFQDNGKKRAVEVEKNKAVIEKPDNKKHQSVINLNNKLELKNLSPVCEGNARNKNSKKIKSAENQKNEKPSSVGSMVIEKQSTELESELKSDSKSRERHGVKSLIRINSQIQAESIIKILNDDLSDGKVTEDLGITSTNVSPKKQEVALNISALKNDKTDSEKSDETKNKTVILEIVDKTNTTEENVVEVPKGNLDKTEPFRSKSSLENKEKKLVKISRLRSKRDSVKSGKKEDRSKNSSEEMLENVELSNIPEKGNFPLGIILKNRLESLNKKSSPTFAKLVANFPREAQTENKTQIHQRGKKRLSIEKTPPKKRISMEKFDDEMQKMDTSEETNSNTKEIISEETNKAIEVEANNENLIVKKGKICDSRKENTHTEKVGSNKIISQVNNTDSGSSKSKVVEAFDSREDKIDISETVSDKSSEMIEPSARKSTISANANNLENTNPTIVPKNNQSHEKSVRESETFVNEGKDLTKDDKEILLPFRKRGRYEIEENPPNKNRKLEMTGSNSEIPTGISRRSIGVRKKGRPAGKSIGISCTYRSGIDGSPSMTKTDDTKEKEVLEMKIEGIKSQLGIKKISLSSSKESTEKEEDQVDPVNANTRSSSTDVDSIEAKIGSKSTRRRSSTTRMDNTSSVQENNVETEALQPDLKLKRGRSRKTHPTSVEDSHEEGIELPSAIPETNSVESDGKKDLLEEDNESDKDIQRGRTRLRGRKSEGRGKGKGKESEALNGPELKEEKVEPEGESVIKEDGTNEIFEGSNDDDEEEDEVEVEAKRSHRGFRGRGRRRRGRGRGRGPTRSTESRDTEYAPSKKRAGSPKKTESKSSATPTSGPTVTCAKCNKEMTKVAWNSHNLYSHNDMSWKVGDEPLDFENDLKLLKRVLATALKKRKGSLRCEKCSAIKRSAFGFVSHLQFCGKTDEEKQALMQKCPICHNIMMPSSMEVHENFHKQQEKQKLLAAQNTELPESRGKRKAAEKATTRISEFTNLVKDEEVPLKNVKQNVRSLFEKPRLKKNINSVTKSLWNKEFAETGKVSCRQPGCTFTADSIQIISDHYSKCNFIPRTTFVCKVCKWFAQSEEEIVLHIQSEHSLDKDDQEYHTDGSSSYESDEVVVENDRRPGKKLPNKPNLNDNRTKLPGFKFIENEITQPTDRAYFPAVRWTLEFQLKNYGERLFEEMAPNSFALLDNETAAKYLPKLEVTMPMRRIKEKKYNALNADNVDWKTWKRFEGGFDEKIATFCVGGPVWALSWVPIPLQFYDRNPDQFVVVSTHPTMESEYETGKSHSGHNIIQIWNLGPLHNEKKSTTTPSLSYAIAHNNGTVWRFEFCPSGCYESDLLSNFSPKDDAGTRRMGLVATACSDGCVHIYSLPFPEQLEFVASEKTEWPIYKTDPVMTLVVNRLMYNNKKQNWQCTSLSWTKEKGHEIIAAGYSNGYVSLWNLTAKSKYLIHREGNTTILNAFKHFHAHNHVVTMVGLVPYGGRKFLATGGFDRYHKFWNLENTSSPQNSILKGLVTGGEWMNHWPCGVYCYDDSLGYGRTTSMLVPVRQEAYQSFPLLNTRSATYGISVSDYGNSVCHGNLAGEILTIFPGQLFYFKDMERYIPKKRMLSSCVEVIDFKKREDETSKSSNCETDEPVTATASNNSTENNKSEQFKEYVYMPDTYDKCKNRFGLAFCDSVNPSSKMTSMKLTKRKILSAEKLTTVPVEQYPFASVNQVSWNPNIWSYLNLAAGYQCGVIRLLNFKAMATSTEWKQFVPKTINAVLKMDKNRNDSKKSE